MSAQIKMPRRVFEYYVSEARASHEALDRAGVPRTHWGERLSLSQRTTLAARRLETIAVRHGS